MAQHPKTIAPNVVDRMVGWLSPRHGLQRWVSRAALARAYEGASRADGWVPKRRGASAAADHAADAAELRARARSLVQNVPVVAQAVNAVIAARIGTGIVPVWADDGLAKRWKAWVPHADYDGLLDFYGLQAKAERARDVDGAVLVRKHVRKMGAVVPLQLQVLEIDYLDVQRHGSVGNNEIIAGIEYNRRGDRVAFYLFERHPGDVGLWSRGRSGQSQRVPADEMLHLFNPARPGQQDGITRLAPIIPKARDLQTYMDAEHQRKQMEARAGILAEMSGAEALPSLPGEKAEAQGPRTIDLGELAGGAILGLPLGMSNPVFVEPKAVPGFVEYVKQAYKEICAGYGVPYELATGDMTEVNFSSSRVRTNQFRREVEMEQWHITVPMFCARVAAWFTDLAGVVGVVPVVADAPDWTTPKWASPNPVQDVASELSAIKGGLQSISETIRMRGYDPEVVFLELESDLQRLKNSGALPLLAALWGAQNPLDLVAAVGEKAKD